MRLNRTKGLPISPFSFLYTFRTGLFGRPVRQYTRRTHDATARERTRRVKCLGGLYNELNTYFYLKTRSLPLEGDMSNNPIPCLSHYLYRSAFIATLFNKQYIALIYYCTHLFSIYTNMFSHDILQPYTLVRPIHQGFEHPITWCEKTEHSHECGTPNL